MAFKTLTAKFPGTCRRCGEAFPKGATIRWSKGAGSYHLAAECGATSGATVTPERSTADDSTVSDHFETGGRSYYRNKRGRCEDAPCCGCCTI